jgi:demethoxyubiquinone hydroxylase (CLK1/Coq7/Cat5 family)
LGTLFPRSLTTEGKSTSFFDQDLVGLISRFVLPFTLNKTIFRKSGFIVKAIVGLVSQKASHFISEDTVVGLWDKVKGLFNKKEKKSENISDEKGIPPLSETY